MSTQLCTKGLRASRSSSKIHDLSNDQNTVNVPRRSSSEDSGSMLHSVPVTGTVSNAALLSPSSSTQSSASFITSASTSFATTATVSDTSVAATIDITDPNNSIDTPDVTESSLPTPKERSISPSSSDRRNNINRNISRPQPLETSGAVLSGSRSTQSSLYNLPMEPLLFGDYPFPENPSLQDLHQVFLLDKSSKQKDFHQSLQLHAHLIGLALSARVSRGLDLAYDHAHDAFKNKQRPDRRNEFISSFNYAFDETERLLQTLAHPQPRPSFLDMMNQTSSTAILTFIHRIRTDNTILATAFKNLQSQELDALLLPERSAAIAQTQANLGHRTSRERGNSMQNPNTYSPHQSSSQQQNPTLSYRQQQSQGVPNFANNQDIVHIILANLFGPLNFERECALRANALKSVFVALLTEKKGERLMIEILERYVTLSEWQHNSVVKAPFEKMLLALLHKGERILSGFTDEELNANTSAFTSSSSHSHHLLHLQQHHHTSGRMSSVPVVKPAVDDSTCSILDPHAFRSQDAAAEGKTPEAHIPHPALTAQQSIVEEFFTEACLKILKTLKEFIPQCLTQLSRLIFAELDDNARTYASLIIVIKFFFYRFMNKCIAYPETYGMMQEVFISEKQRQRILFTTHQRLYRHVTNILTPVPGWEIRSSIIDPRLHEAVGNFVSLFSAAPDSKVNESTQYTLNPVAELSTPAPVRTNAGYRARSGMTGTKSPATTPYLLLCPSDFTTLFYFVCPQLRTQPSGSSAHSSSTLMTRSSSFHGKGIVVTRQRTSSETPPTYPAAMKSAAVAAGTLATSGTSTISPSIKAVPPNNSTTRAHKRASPSFSFFSGAASSLPFKSKPPPPLTLEKYPTAPAAADSSYRNSTFLSLSGIKPGQAALPQTATVEVISSAGFAATSKSCPLPQDYKGQSSSVHGTASSTSTSSFKTTDSTPILKHWSDETLLPDLKIAMQELRKISPGSIKEVPWAVSNPNPITLREPWALMYVEYGEISSGVHNDGSEQEGDVHKRCQLAEIGLALAPSCMAMVMENSSMGGTPRIVTVTKPMLGDQVMDSAGGHDSSGSTMDVDLEVDESDTDSILSSEDKSLANRMQSLTSADKGLSILLVNSNQMLSVDDRSGAKAVQEQCSVAEEERLIGSRSDDGRSQSTRRAAIDRAWKNRIRQTVHSEADMPEEVITVARSIFKILREFDLVSTGIFGEDHHRQHYPCGYSTIAEMGHDNIHSLLLQGIEQAHQFGNHGAAIGFHHSLRVLESSPILRQLDSSKLIYLLAMPIKHRLEHRAGRARNRTMWESFAHSWHMRLVSAIERKRENISALRIKMYYQTCVRSSRAFEKSLGVVVALCRLNRSGLRKHLPAEDWDYYQGLSSVWGDSGMTANAGCDHATCQDTSDQPCHNTAGEGTGSSNDMSSRRYSNNSSQLHTERTAKARRSSFSSYMDNMTSRSFGSYSVLESGLGNLKEREQVTFSSSYNPTHHGMFWGSSNTSSHAGSGFLGDTADIVSDFTMDSREVDAVQRWITDSGIYNFLPGEDNFLRFCMEVESVVRGIGLGGTGIQGAGVPQTTSTVSSSGSDFFVKEVAKFNGQFVAGMGPVDPTLQTKSGSSTSGVAEFIVNSLKSGNVAPSVPTPTGSHFFSTAQSTGSSSMYSTLNSGGSYGAQSSPTSVHSPVAGVYPGGRSKAMLRQLLSNNGPQSQDAIPALPDDPASIYATPLGPTYALYNPPFSTAAHGASTSYSGSTAPGGAPSTVSPHQLSHLPKDMTEFLRRVQLRLTSFVLSEWLELFGEVEADRWFIEFLDEMVSEEKIDSDSRATEADDCIIAADTNQDGDVLPVNQMDLGDKPCAMEQDPGNRFHLNLGSFSASPKIVADVAGSRNALDLGPNHTSGQYLGSAGLSTNWNGSLDRDLSPSEQYQQEERQQQQQRQFGFQPETKTQHDAEMLPPEYGSEASTCRIEKPVRNVSSFSSIRRGSAVHPPAHEEYSTPSQHPRPALSGMSLLNAQVKSLSEKKSRGSAVGSHVKPYDLNEAYRSTIHKFSRTTSPYQKLSHLYALVQLIAASLSYPDSCSSTQSPTTTTTSSDRDLPRQDRMREACSTDNGRPLSSRPKSSLRAGHADQIPLSPRAFTPGTDAIVNEIENLLREQRALRPRHLLRDLQLIAIFIPGSILDLRDDGKAFWDVTVAVSGLKEAVIAYVVQKGTKYVEVDSEENDKSGGRSITHDDEERTRMAEAVRLFTIGAKESNAVAQRELAILYMSLPILPSSSTPPTGYGSPMLNQLGRVPSPISANVTATRYGKSSLRTHTPPPPSPKGTISSASLLGKSLGTASIPIKQRSRHQHSSSGSGSSFGSGVLSGLGIMTGLGSFTATSSMGSGESEGPSNSSSASLHQHSHHLQQTEFADGNHDVEHYHDVHPGRQSTGTISMISQQSNGSLHPNQYYSQHQRQNQAPGYNAGSSSSTSGPDKFNPENVAAAMHWFSLAAAQGDKFSINYLKHKETAGGMLSNLG
ncbi:hypothetical protein BGX28_009551 [Mortierella sp. GBA30]|nr:hypothetical protein BGX28_009551 [Mortierella sp. GBA30]